MALTADHLKRVISRYHERLTDHREALNRLNVYPVPDGDTGTNMSLTVQSVMEEVRSAEGMEDVAGAIAHGSLMGARGNSGVILSQILRGLSDTFRGYERVGTAEVVVALEKASEAAYEAVLRPVEGTILTVLRAAAQAASESGGGAGADLGQLLTRVYERAERELENTPELLPVLKQAGVVDAGAAGFLLLIVAFLEEVTGIDVLVPPRIFEAPAAAEEVAGPAVADLRYEVMFLLDAVDENIAPFRERWRELGDSIVVVGGGGTYNCHIHTDLPAPAVEAGIQAGRPHRLQITDLHDQAAARAFHPPETPPAFETAPVAVVPVVAGQGLAEMFTSLGARYVVTGGQTMNPSTHDLLSAVESVPAEAVILLPNNKNIVPVAEQVDALTGKQVTVVPTVTVPQGLAAMLAYLPDDSDAERLTALMHTAAAGVRTGELTRAVRSTDTPIGPVAEGEWLGLVDGEVAVLHADQAEALMGLLEDLLESDSELVTVITGSEADPGSTSRAVARLEDDHPDLEVDVIDGGQPLYPYLISVE